MVGRTRGSCPPTALPHPSPYRERNMHARLSLPASSLFSRQEFLPDPWTQAISDKEGVLAPDDDPRNHNILARWGRSPKVPQVLFLCVSDSSFLSISILACLALLHRQKRCSEKVFISFCVNDSPRMSQDSNDVSRLKIREK